MKLRALLAVPVLVLASGSAFAAAAPFHGLSVIKINCGGPQYIDGAGDTWQADTFFVGGSTFSDNDAIAGTTDDTLYQTERWGDFSYQIPLANDDYAVTLYFAEIFYDQPGERVMDVDMEGNQVIDDLDIVAQVGEKTALEISGNVTVSDGVLDIDFTGVVDNAKVSAIQVELVDEGHPVLHVVIEAPERAVDFDGDGEETVSLVGDESHTHEFGANLVSFTWRLVADGTVLGNQANITADLPIGVHEVELEIGDDNVPPDSLTGSVIINVSAADSVPGVMGTYGTLLTGAGAVGFGYRPGFKEVLSSPRVDPNGASIGGSPYTAAVLLRLAWRYEVLVSGNYRFRHVGGNGGIVLIDGQLGRVPHFLTPDRYRMVGFFQVADVTSLPLEIEVSVDGGPWLPLDPLQVTHDQSNMKPFINPFVGTGPEVGGDPVALQGVGFFPPEAVLVEFGPVDVVPPAVVVQDSENLVVTSPAGSGNISLRVETPNGRSNARQYTYLAGQQPIVFTTELLASADEPTTGNWGPDGRFYVGTLNGEVLAYTFDAGYNLTNVETISTLVGRYNNNILGIAFDPRDPPSPVRIYVTHNLLFGNNNGDCFPPAEVSLYSGELSLLEGPGWTATTLIDGLPVSNHDHGNNEIGFDNYGNLFIACGGNTNAGVVDCDIGGIPESPLTGSMLIVPITDPGFNGTCLYYETVGGALNMDQEHGDIVDLDATTTIGPWAVGMRNMYGMVFTTRNLWYGTDNGPNTGFGPASTSATTQGGEPDELDEILLLSEGHYYGHPNRNRGRQVDRENVYHDPADAPIFRQYTPPLATIDSSTDGLTEYRATAFGGRMMGNLVVQEWNDQFYHVELSADGRSIVSVSQIASGAQGLDVVTAPGGNLITVDYSGDKLTLARPVDPRGSLLTAYDIHPWRGLPDGTVPFVIGGKNLGDIFDTSVTFGGVTAVLTSVSPQRIEGFVPASAVPTADLMDVTVSKTSTGESSVIPGAFRYLLDPGSGFGKWTTGTPMPGDLGEVAAGAIDGILYVIGAGSASPYAYDVNTGQWSSGLAPRPAAGDHHSLQVIDRKLYLFGGIGNSAAGEVQIYDPDTDSWSQGTDIPFDTGSCSTALIDGLVYVAGGIVLGSTTTQCGIYDPATDSWSPMAPMPAGRNHAAAATDGTDFYIFGGRGPGSGDGNVVANGFDDVQIYHPATDTWETSFDAGSTIPPLPQARGGQGTAIYWLDELWVIGGETDDGAGATPDNVYQRVDVYDPILQTWRLDAPMPTARHGIYPVVYDGRVFVAGGGVQAGNSDSDILEIFER